MRVSFFLGKDGVYGLTDDATGNKLPTASGPWKHFKDIEMKRGEPKRVAINTENALDDIQSKGYHLAYPQIVVGTFVDSTKST